MGIMEDGVTEIFWGNKAYEGRRSSQVLTHRTLAERALEDIDFLCLIYLIWLSGADCGGWTGERDGEMSFYLSSTKYIRGIAIWDMDFLEWRSCAKESCLLHCELALPRIDSLESWGGFI